MGCRAESVQDSDVARRRSLTKKVEVVTEAARKAVAAAWRLLSVGREQEPGPQHGGVQAALPVAVSPET